MEIFAVSSLQQFVARKAAAEVNCLDETLQTILICDAPNLEVLALDGIGATTNCKRDTGRFKNENA
jgi:hypothetical protein